MAPTPPAEKLFDAFPHGILLFDRSGELLRANKAAGRFLGALRRKPDGRAPRCCDLFGCGTPGVLDGVCLAELAARRARPLPDVRVDLPAPAPAGAVWVTTAPVGGSPRRFLIEVRPAQPHDRRRRTEPHWMGERYVRVSVLGRSRLASREGPIEGKWLDQRAGQLFKYLICERRGAVDLEAIAAAMWPNEDAHAAGTVRYFIHRLRRHLEPEPPAHGPSSFVIAAEGGYKISSAVQVDADEFEAAVRAGLTARAQGRLEAGALELERATAMYGGDFLSELPDAAWAFEERERLRTLAETALRDLVDWGLQRGDVDGALRCLRRLVQLQPFDLDLHRQLLAVCLGCGRRSEAVRRYTSLKSKLRAELDQGLDFELSELTPESAVHTLDPGRPAPAPAARELS